MIKAVSLSKHEAIIKIDIDDLVNLCSMCETYGLKEGDRVEDVEFMAPAYQKVIYNALQEIEKM